MTGDGKQQEARETTDAPLTPFGERLNHYSPVSVPLAEKSKEELVRIVETMTEDMNWYVAERNRLIEEAAARQASQLSTQPHTLEFDNGRYSCASCGAGLTTPCSHWREQLRQPGHASGELLMDEAFDERFKSDEWLVAHLSHWNTKDCACAIHKWVRQDRQAMAEKAAQQLANIWIGGMTAQEVRESFLAHVRSLAGADPQPEHDEVGDRDVGFMPVAVEPPQDKLRELVAKWRKIAAECPSKYRNKWRDVFEAVETCASELEAAAREPGASEGKGSQ